MTRVEEVFLEALEDLREGTGKPVERYLERVPATERRQLADLLAGFFASRAHSPSILMPTPSCSSAPLRRLTE